MIRMKKFICTFLSILILSSANTVFAIEGQPELEISAPSAFMMDADTGTVLYEKDPDTPVPIASVTKIMTMLLIMEALDQGSFTLESMVPVSERAMSMGGSTMFLETGEELSVHDMLKGIAVASANDGCVAMAEYIAGNEASFVDKMNARAQELGMKNTHFVNTNGLDDDNHYSSARDVALMSQELIKHDRIFDYTTIWTDSLRDGKFQLANTNKLVRFYDGANGLKTGSTSKAKCCLSATAKRNGLQLIAVVLGAPTSKNRFSDARTLLDYGFSAYEISPQVQKGEEIGIANVRCGVSDSVSAVARNDWSLLKKRGETIELTREISIQENLKAPVYEGDLIGELRLKNGDAVLAAIPLIAGKTVEQRTFSMIFSKYLHRIFEK